MDLLIFNLRGAGVGVVFKIFRIPVNQWTLATAALGGVFLVSGLILLMNYNHPHHFYRAKGSDSDPYHATGDEELLLKSLTRIISLFKGEVLLSSTRFVTRRELTDFRLT